MLKRLLWLFACNFADVSDVAEQDAIADSLVSDLPETSTGDELGEETTLEELEPETAEEEPQTEEDADWLPTEQDRVFPDEALERYAQGRYPRLLAILKNQNTPEEDRQQVRQILHDKLNSDILIRQQSQEPEEEQEEIADQPEPKLPTRQEWFDGLRTSVRQRQDPQVAKDFFQQFNKVWGLSDQQIQAHEKRNPNIATEFTEMMSVMALNLIKTHADSLIWQQLNQQLEQVFPGFGGMYSSSSNARAWDTVRNGSENFSKLPAFGTKEFSTQARAAASRYFGSDEDFENAQFSRQDKQTGQRVALTTQENAQKKYAILAKIMAGQAIDPKLIQQAIRTGAKGARRQQVSRAAGKFSSGTTRSQGAPKGGDDLFSEGLALYRQEHGRL